MWSRHWSYNLFSCPQSSISLFCYPIYRLPEEGAVVVGTSKTWRATGQPSSGMTRQFGIAVVITSRSLFSKCAMSVGCLPQHHQPSAELPTCIHSEAQYLTFRTRMSSTAKTLNPIGLAAPALPNRGQEQSPWQLSQSTTSRFGTFNRCTLWM